MTTSTQEHTDTVFPKQGEFVVAEDPFIAAVAGVGSGKTQGGAIKAKRYSFTWDGALGMVTAPTYPMLRDSTLRTMMEVLPRGSYTFNRSDMSMKLVNGSEILFRSTDEPERLRGPNLAWVWMDEAALSKEDAFKILQGRLRQPGYPHQLWITTTPKGFNWVYWEFARERRKDYRLIHWSARDNPYLTPDFIRHLQESYAGDFALQEIEGEFVVVGGNMFFNRESVQELVRFVEDPIEDRLGGIIKVWAKPFRTGRYIAGGDLAWGETGAYSYLPIAEFPSMEQVAEIHGRLSKEEMAYQAVELLKEYNEAYVGMEANSEGRHVVDLMIELGYEHRMYDRGRQQITLAGRPRDGESQPGWLTDRTTRPLMLSEFSTAIDDARVRPKHRDTMSEMMSFIRDQTGKPGPSEGAYSDRVMGWALLYQMRHYATFPRKAVVGGRVDLPRNF